MKIAIILENAPDCELDRKELVTTAAHGDERLSNMIKDAIGEWTLGPGDTIKIREV